jgi:hypothetical protein
MRLRVLKTCIFASLFIAVCAGEASAGCLSPSLSSEQVAAFRANPSATLNNPDMRLLERETRNLAAADATLADDIVRFATTAAKGTQDAIAAGLAQAALSCLANDVNAAQLIQQAVAGFDNAAFQSTFATIAGDMDTAAVATATEAAVSGVGSSVVVNPNNTGRTTPSIGGGNSVVTPNFLVLGTGLSTVATSSAASVSPVR